MNLETSRFQVKQCARAYRNAGLSFLPIRADGSKRPAIDEWKSFQTRIPTDEEAERMFGNGYGIALVCGKVSGGLEVIDHENKPEAKYADFIGRLIERGAEELLKKLVIVQTPNGGRHLLFRVMEPSRNEKLALKQKTVEDEDANKRTLIEVKAEGGYVVTVGSPAECHPTKRPYTLIRGSFSTIPLITAQERQILIDTAREFNQDHKPPKNVIVGPSGETRVNVDKRPGDDFNLRGDWKKILEPFGCTLVSIRGPEHRWRTPGKHSHSTSAITGFGGTDLLYVFSPGDLPLEPDTAYNKFSAYTFLNHSGDFSAAAKELAAQSYGHSGANPFVVSSDVVNDQSSASINDPLVVNVVNVVRELPEQPQVQPEVFYGLSGDYVQKIEPHTESDPIALLTQFLTLYGNTINRTAHVQVEADLHSFNLFVCLVGLTSKGRKGTSLSQIRRQFASIEPAWSEDRFQFGLSSGEGLIHAVRDPIESKIPIKEKNRHTGEYESVISDHGVTDKRLVIVESEFASTLRVLTRDGNTLSAIIRQAWDSGKLQNLTKNSPGTATDAHISIIAHITKQELLRYMDSTEYGNGFGNRFLWVYVKRSKVLPEGGDIQAVDFSELNRHLKQAIHFARTKGKLERDPDAKKLWGETYEELSEGKPGQLGAMIARAEAQVLRLSGIYALLDCSDWIREEHLKAALALWNYCEHSARFIFGDAIGDPIADELLREVRRRDNGMTRTEIRDFFKRNRSSQQIDRTLGALLEAGLVETQKEPTAGRSIERFRAKVQTHVTT